MNRLKQKSKLKEPVRLRAKSLANGNQSLYLDIYHRGKRVYEFLRLYLIPEKTAEDKAVNAATMKAAMAIKAKRIISFVNDTADIKTIGGDMTATEWITKIIEKKSGLGSHSNIRLMRRLMKHLAIHSPSRYLILISRLLTIAGGIQKA
ncbi:MAG: hypothetical protein K2K23_03950 [Muribaculaceae bacterium]|nr:hypothetical protein [Muribaculaceae bacterium]